MDYSENEENDICLKLPVRSDSLSLKEIEGVFLGKPESTCKVGDLVRGKILMKQNSWLLVSRPHITGTNLDEHWAWLIENAKPTKDAREIISKCDGVVDVCGWLYDRPFLGLSNKSLTEISALGLSFGWDVYHCSE